MNIKEVTYNISIRVGWMDFDAGYFIEEDEVNEVVTIKESAKIFNTLQRHHENHMIDDCLDWLEAFVYWDSIERADSEKISQPQIVLYKIIKKFSATKNFNRLSKAIDQLLENNIYSDMWLTFTDLFSRTLVCQLYIDAEFACESFFIIDPHDDYFGYWTEPSDHPDTTRSKNIGNTHISKEIDLYNAFINELSHEKNLSKHLC